MSTPCPFLARWIQTGRGGEDHVAAAETDGAALLPREVRGAVGLAELHGIPVDAFQNQLGSDQRGAGPSSANRDGRPNTHTVELDKDAPGTGTVPPEAGLFTNLKFSVPSIGNIIFPGSPGLRYLSSISAAWAMSGQRESCGSSAMS